MVGASSPSGNVPINPHASKSQKKEPQPSAIERRISNVGQEAIPDPAARNSKDLDIAPSVDLSQKLKPIADKADAIAQDQAIALSRNEPEKESIVNRKAFLAEDEIPNEENVPDIQQEPEPLHNEPADKRRALLDADEMPNEENAPDNQQEPELRQQVAVEENVVEENEQPLEMKAIFLELTRGNLENIEHIFDFSSKGDLIPLHPSEAHKAKVIKYKDAILHHKDVDREKLHAALVKHGHKFNIDPNKVKFISVDAKKWQSLQTAIAKNYAKTIAESNDQDKKSKPTASKQTTKQTTSSKTTQTRAAIPPKVFKEINTFIAKQIAQAINNQQYNKKEKEELKRIHQKLIASENLQRDINNWSINVFNVFSDILEKEFRNRDVTKERFLDEVIKRQDSLPPFKLVVTSNPQLFRGDFREKTLEHMAIKFLEQQSQMKR